MITTGFWCDHCRIKYVRHMCKGRTLPCRHPYTDAFSVECQAFGRGGEHVSIEYGHLINFRREDVWLSVKKERNTVYGSDAINFWGMRVHPFRSGDWEMWVGEWLATKSDAFVRAFLNRWQSSKFTPDWIGFRDHPWAKRACALARRIV